MQNLTSLLRSEVSTLLEGRVFLDGASRLRPGDGYLRASGSPASECR